MGAFRKTGSSSREVSLRPFRNQAVMWPNSPRSFQAGRVSASSEFTNGATHAGANLVGGPSFDTSRDANAGAAPAERRSVRSAYDL